ncbi:MAG: radical SAM protein [Candidatus Sericytochromatia bacterium]|nr:radical SAM protein [Candidatus Sericytochromatia bacterium]
MTGPQTHRIWVDADGAVWLEDPDEALTPLALALAPDFGWHEPAPLSLGCRFQALRAWPVPRPWPASLPGLWQLHDEALHALQAGAVLPASRPDQPSLLDLKRAIALQLLEACVLCEHRCGVNRVAGERGRCGVGAQSRHAPTFVHLGEEREIAPTLCVPFTGCSWHCVYCHTAELINRVDTGPTLDVEGHAAIFAAASQPGVRSLSFVGGNPDHHLAAVLDQLGHAPPGFERAVVWNSNMYGSPELYRLLAGVVDVYLGDWRYGNDACASRLSGIDGCWDAVARNWELVTRQGALCIARVLILPGHHACCTRPILTHLSQAHPGILVSLLDQYHPAYRAGRAAPELARVPTAEEVALARAEAEALGLRLVLPHG